MIMENSEEPQMEELRIILVGKTGVGKSATANTILGCKRFEASPMTQSVTKKCQYAIEERFGKKIMVVDTPGLFDTEVNNKVTSNEIVRCLGIASPGPHIILLVVTIGRFTKEDCETVEWLDDIFGRDRMFERLIVVFTRQDELKAHNITMYQYVSENQPDLETVLNKCQRRFIGFSNGGSEICKGENVKALIKMIETVVSEKGFIDNEIFREIEEQCVFTPGSNMEEMMDDLQIEQCSEDAQTPLMHEESTINDESGENTGQPKQKRRSFQLLQQWKQAEKTSQEETEMKQRKTSTIRFRNSKGEKDLQDDGHQQSCIENKTAEPVIQNTIQQPNPVESGNNVKQLSDIHRAKIIQMQRAAEREKLRQYFEAENETDKLWKVIRPAARRVWRVPTFKKIDRNI